jgi:MoaA/NifB/PqqE/SkfB family radical SAM enzyme
MDMEMDTYKTLLSKFHGNRIRKVNFFWRGEPTLDDRLPTMAAMAKKEGYVTYTSTNSVTPNMANKKYVSSLLSSLDRITVCVDGYDQKTLRKYRRGASWDSLIKSLETTSEVKSDCSKEMRVLMFKHNENHEKEFMKLARKYNMDKLFFALPIINGKRVLSTVEADKWLSVKRRYRRYELKKEQWVHRDGGLCEFMPIISASGDIAVCCYDWNIKHNLGNIVSDDLETINRNIEKIRPLARKRKLDICKADCFVPGIPVNLESRFNA